LAAAHALRQRPAGCAAGGRKADHRAASDLIVKPRRDAAAAHADIVATDNSIAAGLVGCAEGAAPRGPALLEARGSRLVDRSLHHLGVGERDVVWQIRPLGRKAERRPSRAADAAAAIDE